MTSKTPSSKYYSNTGNKFILKEKSNKITTLKQLRSEIETFIILFEMFCEGDNKKELLSSLKSILDRVSL